MAAREPPHRRPHRPRPRRLPLGQLPLRRRRPHHGDARLGACPPRRSARGSRLGGERSVLGTRQGERAAGLRPSAPRGDARSLCASHRVDDRWRAPALLRDLQQLQARGVRTHDDAADRARRTHAPGCRDEPDPRLRPPLHRRPGARPRHRQGARMTPEPTDLLRGARRTLADVVLPALTDPFAIEQLKTVLRVIDHLEAVIDDAYPLEAAEAEDLRVFLAGIASSSDPTLATVREAIMAGSTATTSEPRPTG